jgi:predicted AlkP superfamily pyrophosphatase or phosphodiesterase
MGSLRHVCVFLELKLKPMKFTVLLVLAIFFSQTLIAQNEKSPKLIVGIVIDQMCYEYLYRYAPNFSKDGFRKIMGKGLNCRNTQYNYVPTYTGPGHASIYTGTTPNNHGIVGNEWFDRATAKEIGCVEDNSVSSIGTSSEGGKKSPKQLKTTTVTDQLKLTYPSAKVVSMSIKDRGAILPGGHLSDGSYWYDYATGHFVTSSFFKPELPKWVSEFNAKGQVEKYMQLTWDRIQDSANYSASGPDNSPYEHLLEGKTTPTFPYDLSKMNTKGTNFSAFTYTPFSNTLLTDFAIASLAAEGLGKDKQTDMLCVSYSTPDIAGHAFGPYSMELQDMYIRLDLEIARLIKQLEKQVGKNEFTLFLTADHAVVPVPQYLMDKKLPGGYFLLNGNMKALKKSVQLKFGADLVQNQDNLNIYMHHARIDSMQLSRKVVADFVKEQVAKWDHVKAVYTAEELSNTGTDDEWREMIRKGYHPRESGDVLFILEPGFLPKSAVSEHMHQGTSHGSAFNYDTHVPLIWYGKGIKKGEVFRKINIADIAATLTHLLYLQRTGAMTGEPILEVVE